MINGTLPSSFRDPSGFLFFQDGSIYRQVNLIYKQNYDHLIGSGLYKALVDSGLLISHEEVGMDYARSDDAYRILKPELIPFISYPYEWCFSQLKKAALTTLEIQKIALEYGMTLKDGSAYNIQFMNGRPVFIDTISFEKYRDGQPWIAYRQFCQHFLAPLALMSYKDIRISQLFRIYMDGIPLDLASSFLPFRTRFKFPLLSHIHLHAKSQRYFANKTADKRGRGMSRRSFLALVDNLESAVKRLKWQPKGTEWADYYEDTNYSSDAFAKKKQILAEFLDKLKPGIVWDLGANTGLFSRVASKNGAMTVSFDMDPAAVEKNYLESVEKCETNILPLILDLTNPSPGIGWENRERDSFRERGPADTVMALALIHHLAIGNNLPLDRIAAFLKKICKSLIIEFVPKDDSQVQRLLSTREDVFPEYKQSVFEIIFKKYFAVEDAVKIEKTQRTLYLMRSR
jgi:ribosomal protein L11 methylase PrmA